MNTSSFSGATMMDYVLKLIVVALATQSSFSSAFTLSSNLRSSILPTRLLMTNRADDNNSLCHRRAFFQQMTLVAAATTLASQPVMAKEEDQVIAAVDETQVVQSSLYFVMRVREATQQETRLIKSGRFKDVQRANVKLAVKFMLENYRLSDNFIKSSTFLSGNRKILAVNAGQDCIQNLQTISEYFDASDVQNIKVGSNSMAGKESLVLNGLDACRKNIDTFLSYFDAADIAAVQSRIDAENELNEKEFDKELGNILNSAPKP